MAAGDAFAEGMNLRIMFQDEARFGRMPVIRTSWAPSGTRPVVAAAVVRQYKYAYGALSPLDGDVDWMMADAMNTATMNSFLAQIGEKYPDDYILMVVDGASSHKSGMLQVPPNIHLLLLPSYCPELNPVENLWDHLREKACANVYFENLNDVVAKVSSELEILASGTIEAAKNVSQMFCRSWIISSI